MKKILSIMLTLVLIFSLAACGGSDQSGGDTTAENAEKSEESGDSSSEDVRQATLQIRVHRRHRQQHHGDDEADEHIMDLEEQRHDRADRDQSRPPPQNQHRSLHGVADAQHAVVQMHTVRVHRRLPVAESAHDRQTHVQHWQDSR